VAVQHVEEQIAGFTGRTEAGDIGVLWRPFHDGAMQRLRLGGSYLHLGGGATFDAEKTPLPRAWSAGAAYKTFSDAWITAVSVQKAGNETSSWRIGQEVWLGGILALRAGFTGRTGFSDGYTLGAGFRIRDIQVDYSFAANSQGYENANRVGITWRFGGRVESLYQEGVRLLRAGQYGEAILKFNEVLELKPDHRWAIQRLREAADLLKREPAGGQDEK
jgi:hypothetical protein